MRNAFSEALYESATANPDIYVIVADISPAGSMMKFQEEYPERFINVGVAEQVMTGMAAGLALKGKQPFTYTIATFTLYRPFEMVRDDLCYQNMPVTIVGMGAGVVYSGLGGTHQTLEDVAVASAVPNMRVIAPCDPEELRDAVAYCATQRDGPVYLRIGKAGEPVFSDNAEEPWEFGKLRYLKRGEDVCVLTYGPITKRAFELAERLETEHGQSVSVVSAHTIKPLDDTGVREALHRHKQVVVLEEHVPHGGLSSRVKEIAWDSKALCGLHSFTLGDRFRHFYGTYDELLDENGLSVERMFAIMSAELA
ncbi:MAG: transketolase [Alphaproteobacteria bacterium]|nr:transketolase [Alphaproteobacteria bacterium]